MALTYVNGAQNQGGGFPGAFVYSGASGMAYNSAANNMLVVYAAIDLASNLSTAVPVPFMTVVDSASNIYIPMGQLPATGGSNYANARVAVWVCPNARPITWVCASPVTGVSAEVCGVMEFSGAPAWCQLSATTVYGSNTGTTISLSGTVSATSQVFVLASTPVFSSSVPTFGAATGFTKPQGLITTPTAPPNSANVRNGIQAQIYTGQFSAGAVNFSSTLSLSAPWSAMMCAFTLAPVAPTQVNANFPRFIYEMQLGRQIGDLQTAPGAWTDISTYAIAEAQAQGFSVTQGRSYELATPEAGELNVKLNNVTGAFTPNNASSPFYPNLLVETPLRVTAIWNGRQYPVGQGFIDHFPQEWPDLPQWGFCPITATDSMELLNNANIASALQAEITADSPYVYIPGNEAYSTQATTPGAAINNTRTNAECTGLIAANYSLYNQRTAFYSDGGTVGATGGQNVIAVGAQAVVETGNTMGFLGTPDGGFGCSAFENGYTGTAPNKPPINAARGAGFVYLDPAGMPGQITGTNGWTVELFVILPGGDQTIPSTLIEQVTLFEGCNLPSPYNVTEPSPGLADLVITAGITNGSPAGPSIVVADSLGNTQFFQYTPSTTEIQHLVLSMSSNAAGTMYLNGQQTGHLIAGFAFRGGWTEIKTGGAKGRFGDPPNNYNYTMGHVAVYPYPISQNRVSVHYNMAVTTGLPAPFQGTETVSMAEYCSAVASYARVPVAVGGPGGLNLPDVGLIGPMYNISGTNALDAMNTAQISEGGMIYCDPQSNTVVLPRNWTYNLAVSATFGDNGTTEVPFEQDTTFDYDDQYLYTQVSTEQENGASSGINAAARNQASVNQYGVRSAPQQTVEVQSAFDAQDRTNWLLNKYDAAQIRAKTIRVDCASKATIGGVDVIATCFSTMVGSIVQINRRPLGGAPISELGIVQQRTITGGPSNLVFEYVVSPYRSRRMRSCKPTRVTTCWDRELHGLVGGTMPQGPSQWATSPPSDAIISASRLNYDMYTYTSNQFNPTGIHFHSFRPLFWEVLNYVQQFTGAIGAAGYANLSQQTGQSFGIGMTCYDTAGLWGAGADYIQGQYQFLPTVPGSDGAGNAGGYYILSHFIETNGGTAPDVLGASMQAETGGTQPVFDGGRQWRSTTRNSCAFFLDLVPTGPAAPATWAGETIEFAPYAYTAQSANFTYNPMAVVNSATTTGCGEISRFFGFWQAINNGSVWGSQNNPGTIKSSWPNGTTINSSTMQGALANPLTFLSNPPSFRGSGLSTTSIPNNTVTKVPLTNVTNTYNGLTNWVGGATSTYTIPVSGMYLIHGQASYSLSSFPTGLSARAGVTINGNTYLGPSYQFAQSGSMNVCPQKTQIFSLAAGDTVSLATIQDTGGATTLAGGVESKLVICWLGSNGATFGGSIGSPVTTYADGYTGPPDTSFRWQAGTPPSTLQTQFQTHLGDDMTFLFNRPYFMGYQATATTQTGTNGAFSANMNFDVQQGIVHSDNGDPWGGWNATNHRWFAPVTGWYLVVHESRIATGSTPTDVAAGLVATPTQGGVAPVATPDWYQHIDVSTTSGNFPGATAIGLYYLVAGQEAVSAQFLAHGTSAPITTNSGGFATGGPNHMEAIWLGE